MSKIIHFKLTDKTKNKFNYNFRIMNESIPKFQDIITILSGEEAAINYLLDKGILKRHIICECNNMANLNLKRKSYRCYTKSCQKECGIYRNTVLENRNVKPHEFLLLAYLWICETPQKTIIKMTHHSSATITNFLNLFREIVMESLTEEDSQIGGENIVVEIDESKFGKRKFNRGHHVEGVWVIGGVERTPERKLFLKIIEKRNSESLLEVIKAHVKQGSIIYTDGWQGYNLIEPVLKMEHSVVNHSLHFVNPENGHHTNTIEGTWSGVKRKIPVQKRTSKISPHLFEFIWRRKNNNYLWNAFISSL